MAEPADASASQETAALQPAQKGMTWMQVPLPPDELDCPPGLEMLATLDQLHVHQTVEVTEELDKTGEQTTRPVFIIKNEAGHTVYTARETSDTFAPRKLSRPVRPLEVEVYDSQGKEVMHLIRPPGCQALLLPFSVQTLEVMSPPGTLIGSVDQVWTPIRPTFRIREVQGDTKDGRNRPMKKTVLQVLGPLCPSGCFGDVKFRVMSADGQAELGCITKQWSGLLEEAFTDADNFSVSFPAHLDVRSKAVMLGALFLIDAMFFERTK